MQWTRPKSVRQIGDIPGHGRIYMEDYVVRFTRKMAQKGSAYEKAAVLLGNYYMYNGDKIYQISGVIEIENFDKRNTPKLAPEMWDYIYSEIKENFTDLEIVGWFYTQKGFSVNDATKLLELHRSNFRQGDKVLYIYEENEKEDRFFLYKSGKLEQQKGFYIYYERNPEMLRYMEKENNRHIHIVEQEDDRVIRNIRGIMKEKEEQKLRKEQKNSHIGVAILGMVALIAVLIGAVSMKNQTTLSQLKEQLHTLQTMAQPQQIGEGNRTTVETQRGGVKKMNTPVPSTSPESTPTGTPVSSPVNTPASGAAAGSMLASQSPVAK